ncbi:hypothetical protein E2562_025524 [Oryza meyeriana var. granulata]|uniref:Uncharacterized protein n=1 Tax=Oryza meyeriana var. granulata TaxID=110450 RepID=A0A6G1FBX4_9ORYZ|nr:hypothetical protein E2562_025524 [Oryza meyeriana var. granulata]
MPPPPATVLVTNGTVSPQSPPSAASFLDSTPGAYTTARASAAGRLLWWPRHLLRLADSARLLARFHPHFLGLAGPPRKPFEDSLVGIEPLVNRSVLVALQEMRRTRPLLPGEDMALTALLRASPAEEDLEVCVHLGVYVPQVFGEARARLAVAGKGRDAAAAKYAPWARMRKSMEKMRPPGVTELLLTNDGDHILEGSITNFFVVCRKEEENQLNEPLSVQMMANKFEVQTAPLSDGILPGIIRQIVIEVCHDIGVPFREVPPSWSKRELWEEAFVTSSLRLIQHVETVQAPLLWENTESKTWADVSWVVKQFQGAGSITTQIKVSCLTDCRKLF